MYLVYKSKTLTVYVSLWKLDNISAYITFNSVWYGFLVDKQNKLENSTSNFI